MKLKILLLAVMLCIGTVSAAEFEIKNQCSDDEENMFSVYNKSGGHAGMPDYYDNQVCADGVSDSGFYQGCPEGMNQIMTFYQRNDSHVSVLDTYNWDLCASDIEASINNSCSQENTIVSVESKDETHVAEPNHFGNQLCSSFDKPENMTVELEMNADSVYVDGETANEKEYSSGELSYPYIVSDQPVGIVSYGEALSIDYSTESGNDVFRMTQDRGSFLIPNTVGSYTEIEDEETDISSRQFLESLEPSFGFRNPSNPLVKVRYDSNSSSTGFEGRVSGNIEIGVRNSYGPESDIEFLTR